LEEKRPQFKVGTTPGYYAVARTAELASTLRKIGFGLTKGVDVIESILDIPHEISYSEGKEVRELVEKMGIELLIHGHLEVPVTSGGLEYYRLSQDTMERSAKSAIFCGATYVLFHASNERWPETWTAAEIPHYWFMVDELERHIREKLQKEKMLREWFVWKYWRTYAGPILLPEEDKQIEGEALAKTRELEVKLHAGEITPEKFSMERSNFYEKKIKEALLKHLENGTKWLHEDAGNPTDIYRIIATYMLIKKDPILLELVNVYEKELEKEGLLPLPSIPSDIPAVENKEKWIEENIDRWVESLITKSKEPGKKVIGDFYHSLVAGKYLEGHISRLLDAIKTFADKEIPTLQAPPEEKEKLKRYAKELKITFETPFMGGAYAGMMTIWHPKQIYAVVKTIRRTLNTDRIFMTIDFEHIAVEGADPYTEIEKFAKIAPDAGKYILSLHVTKPTPLHHHIEVEIGDVDVYKLLWHLRTAGLGKYHTVYFIFERGGEQEPFKRSITALKIMAEFLEKDIPPEKLIGMPEFFGVSTGEIAAEERQKVAIHEHALDPLKGLLTVPEEEFTFLSKAAIEKGVPPEKWKKEELK
jgi:sugar phosphate isomerase/epimerase